MFASCPTPSNSTCPSRSCTRPTGLAGMCGGSGNGSAVMTSACGPDRRKCMEVIAATNAGQSPECLCHDAQIASAGRGERIRMARHPDSVHDGMTKCRPDPMPLAGLRSIPTARPRPGGRREMTCARAARRRASPRGGAAVTLRSPLLISSIISLPIAVECKSFRSRTRRARSIRQPRKKCFLRARPRLLTDCVPPGPYLHQLP